MYGDKFNLSELLCFNLATGGTLSGLLSEFFDNSWYSVVELIRNIEGSELVYIETAFCLAEELFIVKLALQDLVALRWFEPFDTLAFLP